MLDTRLFCAIPQNRNVGTKKKIQIIVHTNCWLARRQSNANEHRKKINTTTECVCERVYVWHHRVTTRRQRLFETNWKLFQPKMRESVRWQQAATGSRRNTSYLASCRQTGHRRRNVRLCSSSTHLDGWDVGIFFISFIHLRHNNLRCLCGGRATSVRACVCVLGVYDMSEPYDDL